MLTMAATVGLEALAHLLMSLTGKNLCASAILTHGLHCAFYDVIFQLQHSSNLSIIYLNR